MEERKVDEMKVMMAIDGSECSHYALQWVLENLGHTISNSKLIIFNVLSPDYLGYAYASTYGTARMVLFFNQLMKACSFVVCLASVLFLHAIVPFVSYSSRVNSKSPRKSKEGSTKYIGER